MNCKHTLLTGKNAGNLCGRSTQGKRKYCRVHTAVHKTSSDRKTTVRKQAAKLRGDLVNPVGGRDTPASEPEAAAAGGGVCEDDTQLTEMALNSSIWFITINSNRAIAEDDDDEDKLSFSDAKKFQKFCKFLFGKNQKILDLFVSTNKEMSDLDSILAFPAEIQFRDVEIGEEKRRLHCHAAVRMTFNKNYKLRLDCVALRSLGEMILGYPIYANAQGNTDVARIRELYLSKQHVNPLSEFLKKKK